jgi:lon-related putative ATP-dependent protease
MVEELNFELCRNTCPDDMFACHSTEDLSPLKEIIGQERAVKALQFGLKIGDKGFNIYISGMPGTGRKTAIGDYLEEVAKIKKVPNDWCYAYNFKDPDKPNALKLPAGKGSEFKKAMEQFVLDVKKLLTEAFTSDEYVKKRSETLKTIEEEQNKLLEELNTKAANEGFVLQRSPIGLILIPIVQGKPINDQEFLQLPKEIRQQIQTKREALQDELKVILRQFRELGAKADQAVFNLNKNVASFALEPNLAILKNNFVDCEEVVEYLCDVENNILENLNDILSTQEGQQPQMPFLIPRTREDPLKRYAINLIIDNSNLEGAPVVVENNPTYSRLFGAMEKEARFGTLTTNFTLIRGGAAHRANGGYLVLPVEGLFRTPLVYESLKRTIQNEKLEIEDPTTQLGFMVTKSMMPEPIPFNAKVILIGNPEIYSILYTRDIEFKELFKVKADFDTTMERNHENVEQYAAFICTLCQKEGLNHLDTTGVAAIVDYSSRLAADQNKLSTQFANVADVIREANFYAKEEGSQFISRVHVNIALEEKIYRSNMIQKKIEEMISKGTLLIDTDGEKVGQVNGLAVLSLGDYSFGKPSKITASIGVGKEGIIDIEREAQMGGPTHTKGIMILGGFLNGTYAGDKPLSLTARIGFEQSYSGVDGDSASSTELYAMLSALSGVPIKQYIAVTGSVNQKGDVQAIGGVNQKIEGFFEICEAKGMNGEQGCMIPHSNVQNLMLKDEVIEAVKEGKFHIWPVKTINEGIEVLTGVKAGEKKPDGSYEEGTINYLVQKRLTEMAEIIKEFRE